MLVGIKENSLALDFEFNRQNLLFKVSGLDCSRSSLMTLQCKFVLVLASNIPLLSDVLSSDTHVTIVKWIAECAQHCINQLAITHTLSPANVGNPVGCTAHGLSPTSHGYCGIALVNSLGRRNNCLQTTAAQAIDSKSRCFDRKTSMNCSYPSNIQVVSVGMKYAPKDHMPHLFGFDIRSLDRLADNSGP